LGNQAHAEQVLIPQGNGISVQGANAKTLQVDTLLPPTLERFPWAGHIGLKMLPQVVAEIDVSNSCLVFTNTRAQSEIWYQAILEARPDWAGLIALHHSSLSRDTRDWVEQALKDGQLKAVVCTSSLDLGVDFLPVERVLQIGSAKGVARLMQRAGPQLGIDRGRRRAGCRGAATHRAPRIAAQALGRLGPASGQHGPGRRFHAG
jgi:ATP-dependent Lhr-like helicase